MDDAELHAELDQIRECARRRYRRRLPVCLAVGVAVFVVVMVWLPNDSDVHDPPGWLALSDAVALVLLLGSVALIWWQARRAGRSLFRWQRERSLALGLPWRQRREVARDVRRGRLSEDPLLRAVERFEIERLGPIVETSLWYFPFMLGFFVYQGLRQLLLRGPALGTLYLCVAGLMLYSGVYILRCRRGLRTLAV